MADATGPGPDQGPDMAQLPNTRRRFSASGLPASASNRPNPAVDTNPNTSSDVDTCRICRGEGTPAEPLFYPCKCSGSIKYVHQDCLMEWLSHSQKKHCELCKTPFRFTKLYAPNMPKTLPFHVFIGHVAQYLLRNMLVWLRGALVFSVWLGWLPFLMRSVWSFLFWISDEGFSRNGLLFGADNRRTLNETGLVSTLSSRDSAGFCPATPLLPATTCWRFTPVADQISLDSIPRLVRALYAINITNSDRPYAAFLRLVFGGIGSEDSPGLLPSSAAGDTMASGTTTPPSLLSDVGFLRNLTRHRGVNRVIIATLEGQIITILVVVCFILIILVRDYVVQQQPEINMRAAFAAGENEVPAPQPDAPGADEPNVGIHPPVPPETGRDTHRAENGHVAGNLGEGQGRAAAPEPQAGSEDVSRRRGEEDTAPGGSSGSVNSRMRGSWFEGPAGSSGPDTPGDFSEDEETTVRHFMRIYRQADGDPERILELAREQNLQDKLDWWMKLTRSKIERHEGSDAAQSILNTPEYSTRLNGESNVQELVTTEDPDPYDPGKRLRSRLQDVDTSVDKGKSRADYTDDSGSPILSSLAGTSQARPRANTDGPRAKKTVNPLANNSWSFGDLATDDERTAGASDSIAAEASSVRSLPPLSDIEFGSDDDVDDDGMGETRPGDVPGTTLPDNPDFDFNTARAVEPRPWQRPPPGDLMGRVTDFMWGEVEAIDPAELVPIHVPDELHDHGEEEVDLAFLDPAREAEDMVDEDDDERDREVVEAAFAAGLDPDAIEDAEDLEGILELLGMHGPVAGLFQNAIFCAFLVAVTLLLGVFLPYNLGRITVWTLANPMRIVRILFSISKFVQDVAVIAVGVVVGCTAYAFLGWWKLLLLGQGSLPSIIDTALETSWNMSSSAAARVANSFMTEMPILSANEMRNFSALSHDALLTLKAYIALAFWAVGHGPDLVSGGAEPDSVSNGVSWIWALGTVAWDTFKELPHTLSDPSSWVINLNLPESAESVNPDLAYWGGMDRFWAILCGYVAFSIVAALYLRRGVPFSSGPTGQDLENSLLDGLKQASGVMKVILIIGIEMLVFPLYCGLLLDVALLPLFENTTVKSRLLFTYNYPLTSIFVHWFVGTGYMFHFALFVSMCRKIMRKGVLYFIRDPDDPEFHPVRDVLERNVTTQLRKILFSAFVYGALVIICLGGVVWGLSYSIPNVLPIHYSSNEPVLEFPIDLLFYNFLMPLAVKFFKPSDGLHSMYTWWFRKCARTLRLTWFLFGGREIDEEGVLVLGKDSPHQKEPWYRKLFLKVDYAGDESYEPRVVPSRWPSMGGHSNKTKPAASSTLPVEDMESMDAAKDVLVATGQLIPDGRFVRSPASDQIKIPKGKPVFLEVTHDNERPDGKPDRPETDIYSTRQYEMVYIPPFFRVRVFLFILFIWMFAAFTGVGITIVPLVFGRAMFKLLIPAHIRTNDIYAFSIGIYILGSLAYGVSHARSILLKTKSWLDAAVDSITSRDAARRAISMAVTASRLLYAYFFLLLVFPIMVISLMELYLLIPLNTWMYSAVFTTTPSLPTADPSSGPGLAAAASVVNINPRHTIRVIQSWTIGVLFLKLGARVVSTWYEGTRPSAAVRAVLRRGWMDPDVAVLTRAFVVPGLVIFSVLVSVPLLVGRALVAYGVAEGIVAHVADGMTANIGGVGVVDLGLSPGEATNVVRTDQLDEQLAAAVRVLVYRLSFPLTALAVATAAAMWNLVDVFRGWKVRIRDEAYLIGERLHNFGAGNGNGARRGPSIRGGGRL
ncbi:E3 ubiquitin-protein ligase march6 [Coniochaeta hoffmannii]|uniref:RING-type E3 ubiquitin transferase n=1 Tax=Coniochaeta hoffmannii TaxID=91930 RepID=A0AA38RKZ6_9PEZI|nr:E3 ubiquitin-protein ligase march6 [Coniochaeta hoffmannii]